MIEAASRGLLITAPHHYPLHTSLSLTPPPSVFVPLSRRIRSWGCDQRALLSAAAYEREGEKPPAWSSLPADRLSKLRRRLLTLASGGVERPLSRLAASLPRAPALQVVRSMVPERVGPLPLLSLQSQPVWVDEVDGLRALRERLKQARCEPTRAERRGGW